MLGYKKITPVLCGGPINAYSSAGSERKRLFHRQAKAFLKALAVDLGLVDGQYDLRSNKAGIAVSGEATLHSDRVYVQVSKSGFLADILYRSCKGRKDFCGGTNHFVEFAMLTEPEHYRHFVEQCSALINQGRSSALQSNAPEVPDALRKAA